MKPKRPKQELYALVNITTGEVKFFPSLVAISNYLGKCDRWASYIIRVKEGKWKNYQIMIGGMFENTEKDNVEI